MITWLVFILYLLAMLALLVLSMGQLHLAWVYRKKPTYPTSLIEPKEWPGVTIQLPIYNEIYVIERLLDCVSAIDYPKEKLEIQVLDDSTDETSQIIAKKVEQLRQSGFDIQHIQREIRSGYKAGALLYGLENAKSDYLAIFDADFLPEKNFLKNALPHLLQNEIGMVQTRWGHLNKGFSLLTKLQAFGLDGHFTVEQAGRNAVGSFINFNGTAGIWRKQCIVEAGGWSADTLTEDLDLSYRAQLKGWKFKYLEEMVSPAELPVVMSAVKSQQYRWNKGAAETARKNLPAIFRADMPLQQKAHAILHLLNNAVFILIFAAAVLSVPLLHAKANKPELIVLFHLASVFVLGFLAIAVFYWLAAKKIRPDNTFGYWIANFPAFMAYSMGLSFHNAIAVAEGYLGIKSPFIRTPKFNAMDGSIAFVHNKYIKRSISGDVIMEGVLCLYFLFGVGLGVRLGDFGLVPFHLMLALGFGGIFIYGLKGIFIHGVEKS